MTQHETRPVPQPNLPDPGQQEPRFSKPWLWAALGVVIALAIALLIGYWPTGSTPPPITSHTVVYQADSSGTNVGTFTLETPTGSQQGEADLPLKSQAGDTGLTFPGFSSGGFVYLSVQNKNAAGSVTCRILVDGKVISENTSTGGYVIATCSSRVP